MLVFFGGHKTDEVVVSFRVEWGGGTATGGRLARRKEHNQR